MPKPLNDGEEVEAVQPATLDEAHALAIRQIEAEDADKTEEKEEEVEEVEDSEEEEESTEDEETEEEEEEIKKDPVPEPPEELDTNPANAGKDKVAVKNSDGDTLYFNNLDEVPEDFEPATYKEWGRAVNQFAKKEIRDEQAANVRAENERKAGVKKELDTITAIWDRDIEVMSKGGMLPSDEKDRQREIDDTYNYMSKRLADGIPVDSFAEANKAMKYEAIQAEKAKKSEEATKIKKEKSSKVMGGSGANPNKVKTREALPAGLTLDQVHAKYSGLI